MTRYDTETHRVDRYDTDDRGRLVTADGEPVRITETRPLRVVYLPHAED